MARSSAQGRKGKSKRREKAEENTAAGGPTKKRKTLPDLPTECTAEGIPEEAAGGTASPDIPPACSAAECLDYGKYDEEKKEWTMELSSSMRLRVTRFKGNTYVDIRKTWSGNPTKTGICLPVDVFRNIQAWPKLEEAQQVVEQNNR